MAQAAAVLVTLLASPIAAQTPRAPAPAAPQMSTPVTQGPPISGMCVFSEGAIIQGSKVGQAVIARLRALKQQVDTELQPEANAINSDAKALDSQRASLAPAAFQAKQANLQLRAANLEKRAQLRGRELQATQQKQFQVIGAALEPILRQLYQQKQCSMLIDRDSAGIRAMNSAMDLSGQAVSALDQKIQTLTFDRETLPETGS
jgi:outer membrane protein